MRRTIPILLASIILGTVIVVLPESTEAKRSKVYCPLIIYRCPDGSEVSPKPPTCRVRCRRVRRPVYPYPNPPVYPLPNPWNSPVSYPQYNVAR